MKKRVTTAVTVACLAAAGSAFAGLPAGTGVNGSLHDMNQFIKQNGAAINADTMGRVCIFCHTPHHAQSNVNTDGSTKTDMAPLWNRTDTAANRYSPYVWVTPANKGTDDNPAAFEITDPLVGPSRLCMSCHDGIIAVDAHGPAMEQAGSGVKIGARGNLGFDLTSTHPIGFNYNEIATWRNSKASNGPQSNGSVLFSEIVSSDQGFAISITENQTTQGTYNDVQRGTGNVKRIKDVLYNGNIMTCASCHEVHNKENVSQVPYSLTQTASGTANPPADTWQSAPNYFLYAQEYKSLICLSCHIK